MSILIAIDPGPIYSAFVICDGAQILAKGKQTNDEFIFFLHCASDSFDSAAIEMIASYGMPVGKEVFETCVIIGKIIRTLEFNGKPYRYVYRKDVKLRLCGSMKAKDSNIRQAILDMYGPKKHSIGTKAKPGPLYGVRDDIWSALAVAITAT